MAFTLVNADSPEEIFAFGLEIRHEELGKTEEAVTYRRDPKGGQSMFGVHASAQAAQDRYSIITPLLLKWHDEEFFNNLTGQPAR